MVPQMPFGQIAAKASGAPANLLPPMPKHGSAPHPAGPLPVLPPSAGPGPMAPPPAAAPPMGPAPGLPSMPPPGAPGQPPYTVRLQPDGSSVYVVPSPDGDPSKDVVLAVNKPPKLPPAFQPPAPPAQ